MPEHVGFYNFKQIDNDVNLMPLVSNIYNSNIFCENRKKEEQTQGKLNK